MSAVLKRLSLWQQGPIPDREARTSPVGSHRPIGMNVLALTTAPDRNAESFDRDDEARPFGCGTLAHSVTTLALTTVDLARIQFATTSLYHFLFVPLTLGLAPLVAVMQTLWYRAGDEAWLRLTRFFGTLMLINFAIGVATGLVQEFQFGMNWSVYSKFVGDVFGAPLAIEGLAAFMLESTFLGLWIFGWDRLSQRVHLATIWLFALGSWRRPSSSSSPTRGCSGPSARPSTDGRAELTSIWELFANRFAIWAYIHVLLVGLTTAAVVIFGVACWHLVRGRNQDLFRHAAKLALIVGVPISAVNLGVGSQIGRRRDRLPADEDRRHGGARGRPSSRVAFSLFQIGGFTEDDQTPTLRHRDPAAPVDPRDRLSWNGEVQGMNELQASGAGRVRRRANYIPPVRTTYWACGSWRTRDARLPRRSRSARSSTGAAAWSVRAGSSGSACCRSRSRTWRRCPAGCYRGGTPALDRAGALEDGRCQLTQRRARRRSPRAWASSSASTSCSLVVDVVLMRRYARVDPPEVGGEGDECPLPAVSY